MMEKRINVSGDIESRRKIAERRIPAAVQPVIIPEQDERQKKESGADEDGKAGVAPKARRRKTEGNP